MGRENWGRSMFRIKSPTLSRAHSTHPIKVAIIIVGITTNHEAITSHRSAGSGRQNRPRRSLLPVTHPGRVLVITTSRKTSNSAKFRNSTAMRQEASGSAQAAKLSRGVHSWPYREAGAAQGHSGKRSLLPLPDPLWTHWGPSTACKRATGSQAHCSGPSGGLGRGSLVWLTKCPCKSLAS